MEKKSGGSFNQGDTCTKEEKSTTTGCRHSMVTAAALQKRGGIPWDLVRIEPERQTGLAVKPSIVEEIWCWFV